MLPRGRGSEQNGLPDTSPGGPILPSGKGRAPVPSVLDPARCARHPLGVSQQFGVWGFVTGGALPERELQVGDATIRRLHGEHLDFANRKQRSLFYLQGVRLGHAVHPSTIYVYSPWIVQWLVSEATSRDAAVDAVRQDKLPRLLAALNSLRTGPYRVELMRVGEVNASGAIGREYSPYSTSVMQTFGPSVRAFTAEENAALRSRMDLLQGNHAVREIARYFQDAELLLDLRGGLPASMAAAPFTSFHRFVEGVVQARYRRSGITEEERERQRAIVEDLLSKLQNRKRRGKHPSAIAEAAKALSGFENHGFPARLASVVQGLKGTGDLTRELQAFYNFRNRYFAHTGTTITDELAFEWSQRAARACRELLELWLVAEGAGSVAPEREGSSVLATGAQDYPVRLAQIKLDPDAPLPDTPAAGERH